MRIKIIEKDNNEQEVLVNEASLMDIFDNVIPQINDEIELKINDKNAILYKVIKRRFRMRKSTNDILYNKKLIIVVQKI